MSLTRDVVVQYGLRGALTRRILRFTSVFEMPKYYRFLGLTYSKPVCCAQRRERARLLHLFVERSERWIVSVGGGSAARDVHGG